MKKLIGLTLSIVFMPIAYGNVKSFNCHTPRMLKAFKIKKDEIILQEKSQQFKVKARDRYLSSHSLEEKESLTKTFQFEGHNYRLHIENTDSFSEVEDYVNIKSPRGHEITYPLNCRLSNR